MDASEVSTQDRKSRLKDPMRFLLVRWGCVLLEQPGLVGAAVAVDPVFDGRDQIAHGHGRVLKLDHPVELVARTHLQLLRTTDDVRYPIVQRLRNVGRFLANPLPLADERPDLLEHGLEPLGGTGQPVDERP
jgi:hypothetical protein